MIAMGIKAYRDFRDDTPAGRSLTRELGDQVIVDFSLPDDAVRASRPADKGSETKAKKPKTKPKRPQ